MRVRLVVLLAMIAGLLPLITDAFLPALRPMLAEFHADVAHGQLVLSLPLVGFAVAQLLMGLYADRYGRRPVLVLSIVLLLLASLGGALANSFAAVLLARIVQAIGAAGGPVLSRAIVRDLCDRPTAARILSWLGLGMAVVPLAMPMINSHVVALLGWRAAFGVYVAYAALALGLALAWIPETLAAPDARALEPARMWAAVRGITDNRACLGYVVCYVTGYAGLFVWISGAPHLLGGYFHVAPEHFGYWWAVPVATYMLGGLASVLGLRYLTPDVMLRFGAAIILTGAVLLALSVASGTTLVAFVGLVAFYNFGWSVLTPQAQAGALSFHPELAGRTSALLGFLQMLGAATSGWLFGRVHDGTPRPASYLMLGAALACALSLAVLVRGGALNARRN